MTQWLVIGIGNEFRGDDAIGCIVARKLHGVVPDDVRVIEHQGDGTTLLCFFGEAERVILVDAVRSGKSPGFIHRLDLHADTVPANIVVHSSHQFGVLEAVALARELHTLPSCLLFFGIEAAQFTMGDPLSPDVERAVSIVVDRIVGEIAGRSGDSPNGTTGRHTIERKK
jgi:hydrogenase maturation protease